MQNFFKNKRGATAVEFAFTIVPVMFFLIGIMQTGWLVWSQNMLRVAVDAAARCGAINSTTSPCFGNTTSQMIQTANQIFLPGTASFTVNAASCSSDGGSGLVGTYTLNFLLITSVTVTAKSCYPTIS